MWLHGTNQQSWFADRRLSFHRPSRLSSALVLIALLGKVTSASCLLTSAREGAFWFWRVRASFSIVATPSSPNGALCRSCRNKNHFNGWPNAELNTGIKRASKRLGQQELLQDECQNNIFHRHRSTNEFNEEVCRWLGSNPVLAIHQ